MHQARPSPQSEPTQEELLEHLADLFERTTRPSPRSDSTQERVQEKSTPLCPIDNKDDAIQKISAVVAGGRASGRFAGPSEGVVYVDGKWRSVSGYATLSGETVSDLAQLLTPPLEPSKPSGFGAWWFIIWIPAIFAISLLTNLFALPAAGIIGLSPGQDVNAIPPILQLLLVLYTICIAFPLAAWIVIRFLIRKDREIRANNEQVYIAERKKWEKARLRWERLYYCHRHGIVFDPDTRQTCEPFALKQFLFA